MDVDAELASNIAATESGEIGSLVPGINIEDDGTIIYLDSEESYHGSADGIIPSKTALLVITSQRTNGGDVNTNKHEDGTLSVHPNPISTASKSTSTLSNQPKYNLCDPALELSDPNPDILELFQMYNALLFENKLAGVEVRWSPRMTLCAGICLYAGRASGYVSIRLSRPLLSLRPRSDTVNTLLHEMIHALLFLEQRNTDHDGHGAAFLQHAARINAMGGSRITVYHTFHDEVDSFRVHEWQCDGACAKRPPYFGRVRRAMNRPPGPSDYWWPAHQANCGGIYVKVAGPEKKEQTQERRVRNRKVFHSHGSVSTHPGTAISNITNTALTNRINTKSRLNTNAIPLDRWLLTGEPLTSKANSIHVQQQDSSPVLATLLLTASASDREDGTDTSTDKLNVLKSCNATEKYDTKAKLSTDEMEHRRKVLAAAAELRERGGHVEKRMVVSKDIVGTCSSTDRRYHEVDNGIEVDVESSHGIPTHVNHNIAKGTTTSSTVSNITGTTNGDICDLTRDN